MFKQIWILSFILPCAANANILLESNIDMAKKCMILEKTLIKLTKAQRKEKCLVKLGKAGGYMNFAATSILKNNKDGARNYLKISHDNLSYAEANRCKKGNEIHQANEEINLLIHKLS